MVRNDIKSGKGFINKLLNSDKLPEIHLPGHTFTGPGTKLKERLLRGDAPKNRLDAAARDHDIAYALFKDVKDRHVFDKRLQDEARKIRKDSKESFRNRAEAALVGGVMSVKRKLGMGV